MIDPMDERLIQLAERCEKATGRDRELSEDIARAMGWTQHTDEDDPVYCRQISTWWKEPWAESWSTCAVPPDYTASLDAAMTLVPEGMFARLYCEAAQAIIVAWTDTLGWEEVARSDLAATPTLALTAACLRARASLPEGTHHAG